MATLLLAVPLWIVVVTPGVSAALSECQRCEQTGDCSTAYRGTPGQFCGHWLDRASQRQSCCCPVGAECRVSNYACNCAVRNARPNNSGYYQADPLLWLWWLIGALVVALCCGGCIYMVCARRGRSPLNSGNEDGDGVPVAYPVNAQSATVYGAPTGANYGTAPPLYTTPGYAAPVYGGGAGYGGGYGGYDGRGGMGAGTGAALGGAAGLLGGVLLGEAIADAGDRGGGYANGGFGGTGGGGGGFDAGVGDFGGDF